LISTTIKGNLPVQDKRKISYRSHIHFDIDKFDSDLQKVVISKNSDIKNASEINYIYSNYEKNVKTILDKHAPLKTRYPRKKSTAMYE
jgi:hypothetical protein